jgi:hypothetical protein
MRIKSRLCVYRNSQPYVANAVAAFAGASNTSISSLPLTARSAAFSGTVAQSSVQISKLFSNSAQGGSSTQASISGFIRQATAAFSSSVNQAASASIGNRINASGSFTGSSAFVASSTASAGKSSKLGANLFGYNDYAPTAWAWTNAFKAVGTWISGVVFGTWNDERAIPLDTNGYPSSLLADQAARAVLFTGASTYPAGNWALTWDGSGTWYVQGASVVSSTSNRIVLSCDGSSMLIFNLHATTPGNNVRNVRFVQTIYEGAADQWHPQFLSHITPYSVLRFMDVMKTNNSTVQTWSQRSIYTYYSWAAQAGGMPIEALVSLCNAAGVDGWFNLPHLADNTYCTNLATYIRDNLAVGRKAYIEYSNELWNGMFGQMHYWYDPVPGTDTWIKLCAERSSQIMDIFSSVFTGQTSRIIRVLGAQAAYHDLGVTAMDYLNSYTHHDVVAIAPYFGNQYNSFGSNTGERTRVASLSLASFMNELQVSDMPNSLTWVDQYVASATARSLGVVMYECGQHLVRYEDTADNAALDALFSGAQTSSQMGTIYTSYLNGISSRIGNRVICIYTDTGAWSATSGYWGLKPDILDSNSSYPKSAAVVAWAAANP